MSAFWNNITAGLGAIPVEFLYFLGIALVVTLPGFFKFVYFISIGYAFSVTAVTSALLILSRESLDLWQTIHAAGLIIYSLRLGIYILIRDKKPGYRKSIEGNYGNLEAIKFPVKISIWITVSLLYALMTTPLLYISKGASSPGAQILQITGVCVLYLGLIIETIADNQKSKFKKKHPRRFCDTGLYKFSRCPNFFGEILVWVGNFTAAILFFNVWSYWLTAVTGLVSLILIMIGSARRLELKQEERYGGMEEFREYTKKTPILFPFLPLYSLKKAKIYLG